MHKNIVIILLLLAFKSTLFGAQFELSEAADFRKGVTSQVESEAIYGSLVIQSPSRILADDFGDFPKVFWTLTNLSYSIPIANVIQISGGTNALMSSPYNIQSQTFRTEFEVTSTGVSSQGAAFLIGANGIKAGVTFEKNTGWQVSAFGLSSVNVAGDALGLALERDGNQLKAWQKSVLNDTWVFLGASTTTQSTQALGFGTIAGSGSLFSFRLSKLKVTPVYSQGSWTSAVLDLTATPTTVGRIEWDQELPVGTRIEVQTSTSSNGVAWSAWSAPYTDAGGSTISSPSARYMRVAATLYADFTLQQSPRLDAIRIHYPAADPLAPLITPLSHPAALWASPTALSLLWAMPAGNPAPEASYTYWLKVDGALTATASAAVPLAAVSQQPLTLALPQEGDYALDLRVTADVTSGGRTVSAQTYYFGYDATAPGQTDIASATHPPLLFTNNRNPVFSLTAADSVSGISGYAAVLDKAPTGDPGSAVNAGNELRFADLDNGTWYLHARAIDRAGNLGPVTHYGIRVDFNGALLSLDYVKALPNPVRTDTARLEYELAAPATELTLEFLNSQGELLKTVDGSRAVGKNYYAWDLGGLANGVYLFRVKARSAEDGKWTTVVRKVAVIR